MIWPEDREETRKYINSLRIENERLRLRLESLTKWAYKKARPGLWLSFALGRFIGRRERRRGG